MTKYLLLLLISLSTVATAQVDTFYFDEKWKGVSSKELAAFYRTAKPMSEGSFLVHDYYANGDLQMEGTILAPSVDVFKSETEEQVMHGYFTFYQYNGKKKQEGSFKNDKKDGEWTYYYDTTGVKKTHAFYKDGLKVGDWETFYDTTGNLESYGKYRNDSIWGEWRYFYNRTKVIENIIIYDGTRAKVKTFDVDGDITSYYEYADGKLSGKNISYHKNGQPSRISFIKESKDHGTVTTFRESGRKISVLEYIDGVIIEMKVYYEEGPIALHQKINDDNSILAECFDTSGLRVDCKRLFAGKEHVSNKKLYKSFEVHFEAKPDYDLDSYIENNKKLAKWARRNNINGNVLVSFIVHEDGSVFYLKTEGDQLPEKLKNEVIDIVSKMPPWRPAVRFGLPVKMLYKLEVTY